MGLTDNFLTYTLVQTRVPRLIFRKIQLIFMLILHTILPWFFKNKNIRHKQLNLPQPAYYNSFSDVDLQQQFQSRKWISQCQQIYRDDSKLFDRNYASYNYDALVKAYFPQKLTALQSINAQRLWTCSYWNQSVCQQPEEKRFQLFRNSDVLFADMMINTQGIYKCLEVKRDDNTLIETIKKVFKSTLEKHRKHIGKYQENCIIEALINNQNLFYIDYPQLRKAEKQKQNPYINHMKTTVKNSVDSYIQIPFAIFSRVKGYIQQDEQQFICLAAVFNDNTKDVYHPFDQRDMMKRDQWQMAKCHMACADCNDFTIRMHLGTLHYASSIYTTPFVNLAKSNKNLKWLKTQFIDIFSKGLLQVNFSANLTLADHKQPIAQKIFHLQTTQSAKIMLQNNTKFNILQFDPDHLGNHCYKSHAIQISRLVYKKIQFYVDYLFVRYQSSWSGKMKQIGHYIFQQVHGGDYDALPNKIQEDQTPNTLKKLITNLIYLWVVHHGQTFSNTSVCNNFYFYPSMMRKPLSSLKQKRQKSFDGLEKQKWLPNTDIIKDYMSLAKFVTFRADSKSLVSKWNNMRIINQEWIKLRKHLNMQRWNQDFGDFWNDITLQCLEISYHRVKKGLFMIHWLLPHQLVSALNI